MAKNKEEVPVYENGYNPADFVDEQLGFLPYWNPVAGKQLFCKLVGRDDRDPDFIRYVFENLGDILECYQGPAEEAESVAVAKGERFSCSGYYQLTDTFDAYLENGIEAIMTLTALEQVKTSNKKTVWRWKMSVPKAQKDQITKLRLQSAKETKQLPASK